MGRGGQGRLADKEAAEAEAAKLRGEVAELSLRLVEMKSSQAERMNEVNKMCDQMVPPPPPPLPACMNGTPVTLNWPAVACVQAVVACWL